MNNPKKVQPKPQPKQQNKPPTNISQEELTKKFEALGYNTLNAKLTAEKCVQDPGKEYKALKVLSHKALSDGRDAINKGDFDKANKYFSFAYQMRCTCNFIWKNMLGQTTDVGHQKYLEVSRYFSQFSLKRIPDKLQREKIETMMKAIKD